MNSNMYFFKGVPKASLEKLYLPVILYQLNKVYSNSTQEAMSVSAVKVGHYNLDKCLESQRLRLG